MCGYIECQRLRKASVQGFPITSYTPLVWEEGLSMGKAQAIGGGELFASNCFYTPFFKKHNYIVFI